FNNDSRMQTAAQSMAQAVAAQAVSSGEAETHLALSTLKDVIRRVSGVPGQRCIVLVSPGFLTPQQEYDVDNIIDQAMRANIIINALDARGLYVVMPGGDITEKPSRNTQVAGIEGLYQMSSASAEEDVMAELADATGGIFAAEPEVEWPFSQFKSHSEIAGEIFDSGPARLLCAQTAQWT